MVSDCSSPVCDTVGTYHKGNNLRGSSDGLTNIPLLLKEPDLKLTQALELIILKYFLSLKEFQLKRNLGWLQMVMGSWEAVVTQVGFALGVLMSVST